jgi:LysM repeat protein
MMQRNLFQRLVLIIHFTLFIALSISAQTWSANTSFGGWYGDSPVNTPNFTSANLAISGTPMTAGAGVTLSNISEASGGTLPSIFKIDNVNSTTFAMAVANNDYIKATVSLAASNNTKYRLTQTGLNGVSSASGGTYTLSLVVLDMATSITSTLFQDVNITTALSQNQTLATPYIMEGGRTYELRWYIHTTSSTPVTRSIDNPNLTFQTAIVGIPTSTCSDALQICNGVTLTAATSAPAAETGPYYGCLGSAPNPTWLYVKTATAGTLAFNLYLAPSRDIDFILWGPFTAPTCGTALNFSKYKACDYTTLNGGVANLGTVAANQYYMILVTNYSRLPGNIGITLNASSTATLACPAVATTPCTCGQPTNCGLNTVPTQAAADAMIATNTNTVYDLKSFDNSVIYPGNMFQYCTTYTTGPNETRIGVRQYINIVSTCSFTRTYQVTQTDCATPATFVGTGGTRNYQYYTTLPNTTYRICANISGFNGTCNTPSVGDPDAEVVNSSFIVFNATPRFNYAYNCSTATSTGIFTANGTGGQNGTVTFAIDGSYLGSATFAISGTGFTGTLTTNITAGQTSVTLPVVYDGTGTSGTRTLTITSPQGNGSCSTSATVIADCKADGGRVGK